MKKSSSPSLEKKAIRLLTVGGVDSLSMLSTLDQSYFATEVGEAAFERLKKIFVSRGKLATWSELTDDPTLSDYIRSALKSVKIGKPNEAMYKSAVSSLSKFRKIRKMIELQNQLTDMLNDDDLDIDDAVLKVVSDVSGMNDVGNQIKTTTLSKSESSAFDSKVKELLNGTAHSYLPTGFKTYDSRNGGVPWGSLFIIAATTGGQKSVMVKTLSTSFASQGASVGMASMEMADTEVIQRMLAEQSQTEMNKFIEPKKRMSPEERKKIWSAYQKLKTKISESGGRITFMEKDDGFDIDTLLSFASAQELKVLVIDYVGLLNDADDADQAKALSRVCRKAKIWATNNKTIAIVVAQLSEEGIIRYSRAMKEHASLMWSWVYTNLNRESKTIRVEQPKSRGQDPFPFDLYSDPAFMTIRDLTDEEMKDLAGGSNRSQFNNSRGRSKSNSNGKRRSQGKGKKPVSYIDDLN